MCSLVMARREAVRLILESPGAAGEAQRQSEEAVRRALSLLSERDAQRTRRLIAHIRTGRLRGCEPQIQQQVDAALDWLAEQVMGVLIVPQDVLWHLRDMLEGP